MKNLEIPPPAFAWRRPVPPSPQRPSVPSLVAHRWCKRRELVGLGIDARGHRISAEVVGLGLVRYDAMRHAIAEAHAIDDRCCELTGPGHFR
jgi:hypothetical protein